MQQKRMAIEGVKISSDVAYVFTNGMSKEEKEQIIPKPINIGFLIEK